MHVAPVRFYKRVIKIPLLKRLSGGYLKKRGMPNFFVDIFCLLNIVVKRQKTKYLFDDLWKL